VVIHIDSENSLRRVADYCHDAVLDTDKIKYDKDKRAFSLVLTREMWEEARESRSLLFFRTWKMPKVESVLTLHSVVDAEIHISDVQDVLVGIDYDARKNLVRIRCMIGTTVCLKVEDVTGTLEDTGKAYFDGTGFTSLGSRP
jgi:hypothetical protein